MLVRTIGPWAERRDQECIRDWPIQFVSLARRSLARFPALLALVAIVYLTIKYSPVIARIFEAQPLFMPLKVKPVDRGEAVEFNADDGVRLRRQLSCGRERDEQAGVIVYCHEYLSDRWSFHPYLDHLRDLGFSLSRSTFAIMGRATSIPTMLRCNGRPTARFTTCGVHSPICDRVTIMIRRASGSSASAGAERRR